VVCRAAGLETNSAAADYVALYHGDKKTLAESLSVIQETSAKILNDLLPERSAALHERTSNLTPDAAPPRQDSIAQER
jgi:hypothetical protein